MNMEMDKPLLKIRNLSYFYGDIQALFRVSLTVCEGQIVSLVGPNGSGKTTIMKAVAGLLRPVHGEISYQGERIHQLAVHQVVRRGLVYVPEGMKIFPLMNVLENLEVGAYVSRKLKGGRMDFVFNLFPVLAEKRWQLAKTLSGGQKRMLTLARGMMSGARLLILDDPFLGLAPKDIKRFCHTLRQIRSHGFTLFMAGQHVRRILSVATRAYLIEEGKITLSGSGDQLRDHPHLQESLFGIIAQAG
jgi:branched-chain amino acid transport system ATP-binding protein